MLIRNTHIVIVFVVAVLREHCNGGRLRCHAYFCYCVIYVYEDNDLHSTFRTAATNAHAKLQTQTKLVVSASIGTIYYNYQEAHA